MVLYLLVKKCVKKHSDLPSPGLTARPLLLLLLLEWVLLLIRETAAAALQLQSSLVSLPLLQRQQGRQYKPLWGSGLLL